MPQPVIIFFDLVTIMMRDLFAMLIVKGGRHLNFIDARQKMQFSDEAYLKMKVKSLMEIKCPMKIIKNSS